jgi:hypothetical protein
MQLFRCPNCQHWRCRNCEDNSRLNLRCCKCGEVALALKWYMGEAKGRPHDLDHSPRLGTGRPPSASRPIVLGLMQFLDSYNIPLNAFSRHTTISAWAIRQARAGMRNLSVTQENLIKATMERIKGGRLWLRRVTRQRWELEWVETPYNQSCGMKLSHCHGGLLPTSCPRQWKECILSGKDWKAIERVHRG